MADKVIPDSPVRPISQSIPVDMEKAKGLIFGLAIGDAMGRVTEFMSLSAIKTKYGAKGIQELPDPWPSSGGCGLHRGSLPCEIGT